MKEIIRHVFLRGGGSLKAPKSSVFGYTLAEVIVVMLIIAVVVSVTIGITKAKLNNIVSYTYYNAYSTLRSVSAEMLSDFAPNDEKYMANNFISNFFRDLLSQPAYALCAYWHYSANSPDNPYTDFQQAHRWGCERAGGKWCDGVLTKETGCYSCCTSKDESPCGALFSKECAIHGKVPDFTTCTCKPSCQYSYAWAAWNKCTSSGGEMNDYPSCTICTCPAGKIEVDGACANPPSCSDTYEKYVKYMNCVTTGGSMSAYPSCTCTCPSDKNLENGKCAEKPDVPACPLPEDIPCGYSCDPAVGVPEAILGFSKNCSDETYEWSDEKCKCIPSPRTLPRKGMNFCKLFEEYANIMSGTGVCNGSTINTSATDFSDKSPDLILRNGLRLYNMHQNPERIDALRGNTQGGTYDGVDNTNEWGYTVYVDIDGVKGDSQLWSDVYPFYITLSGKIIPAYDTSNLNQSGGDSVRHLQVSVENENYNNGKRSIKWLAKSVPFKEGACIAGYVGDATPYCKNGTSFTKASECTTNYNSLCRVKQIQPVKFFF